MNLSCVKLLAFVLILADLGFGEEINFKGLQLTLPKGEKIDKPFRIQEGGMSVSGELIDRKKVRSRLSIRKFAGRANLGYGILFKHEEAWKTEIGTVSRHSVYLNDSKKGVILLRVSTRKGHDYDIFIYVPNQLKLRQWEGYCKKLLPPLKAPGPKGPEQE